LEEAVKRPTISGALGNLAGTIARSSASGAAINGLMTTANMIGEQVARMVTPNIKTILSDPDQQAQFSEELANAMEQGAELFPLMELPGAGMRFLGDTFRARMAKTDAQALTDLAQGVTQSKTWNRSTRTFIDFMRRQTEGTPIENMYLDRNAVMTLYQKGGVYDPLSLPQEKDGLLGWLPDRDQQLKESAGTGGDIVVPTSEFVSRLSGTDAFNELLPDVRVRQDGMTLREAQDVPGIFDRALQMMEAGRQMAENHAKGLEEDQPMQRVYNDIYPKIVEAGYEPRVADHYARVAAAEAASSAEREPGIYGDAWDAYQRMGLQVRRGGEGEGAGLNQAAAMYRSPKSDVAEYVEGVLKNPSAKKSYFEYGKVPEGVAQKAMEGSKEDIANADVVLPSDIVKHGARRHPDITADRWPNLLKDMDGAQEIFEADPKRASYGGKPLGFVSYHDGKGTVVVAEHAVSTKNDRLVVKTYFTDSENGVRNWVEKEKARTNSDEGLGAGGSPAYPSPAPGGGDVTPDTSSDRENILPGDEEINESRQPIQGASDYIEESQRARRQLEEQGQQKIPFTSNRQKAAPAETPGGAGGGTGEVPLFSTFGRAYVGDLNNGKPVSLVGKRVNSYADLADLFQVWRDSRYETFRYIYIKGNRIVGHEGISQRLPSQTKAFIGDLSSFAEHIKERIAALGADWMVLCHNHPSGDPAASASDVAMTGRLMREVPEIEAHIIINSGKYGLITRGKSHAVSRGAEPLQNLPMGWKDPLLGAATVPHEALGSKLSSFSQFAGWAKALMSDRNRPVLVYVDAKNSIRGLQETGAEKQEDWHKVLEQLPEQMTGFGSSRAFLVLPESASGFIKRQADSLVKDGTFLDIITMNGKEAPLSVQAQRNYGDVASTQRLHGGKRTDDFPILSVEQRRRG
ncbi:MAG: JAB domain-containing protein, partial [Syntrophobacteraceae bacterium]